jgi:GNAT superfamily N-acetyltransferase
VDTVISAMGERLVRVRRWWRRTAFRRLVSRARRAVYLKHDDMFVVAKVLEDGPPPVSGRPLRVQLASTQHAAAMAKVFVGHDGFDMTERELRDLFATRMSTGAQVLLGFDADQLFGFLWWADAGSMERVEPLPNVRYGIRLEPDDVYAFGLFVTPERRDAGLSTWFLTSAEAKLKRLGYNRLLGYILAANRPARWLFAITGHDSVGPFSSDLLVSRLLRINRSIYLVTREGFRPLRGQTGAGRQPPR